MKISFILLLAFRVVFAADCSTKSEGPTVCSLADYLRTEGYHSEDFDVAKSPKGFEGQSASTARDGSYCLHSLQGDKNEYHFCGENAAGSDWRLRKDWTTLRNHLEFWRQIPGKYKEMQGNLSPETFYLSQTAYARFEERLKFGGDGVGKAASNYLSNLVPPATKAVAKYTVSRVQEKLKEQLGHVRARRPRAKTVDSADVLLTAQASRFLRERADALAIKASEKDSVALWRDLEPIWTLYHAGRAHIPPGDVDLIGQIYSRYFNSKGILNERALAKKSADRARGVSLKLHSNLTSVTARVLRRLANENLVGTQDARTDGTFALVFAADRALARGEQKISLELAVSAARNLRGEKLPQVTAAVLANAKDSTAPAFLLQGLVAVFSLRSEKKIARLGDVTVDSSFLIGSLMLKELRLQDDLAKAAKGDSEKLAALVRSVGNHPNASGGKMFTLTDWEELKAL